MAKKQDEVWRGFDYYERQADRRFDRPFKVAAIVFCAIIAFRIIAAIVCG